MSFGSYYGYPDGLSGWSVLLQRCRDIKKNAFRVFGSSYKCAFKVIFFNINPSIMSLSLTDQKVIC